LGKIFDILKFVVWEVMGNYFLSFCLWTVFE